jgi:hypothetical protein
VTGVAYLGVALAMIVVLSTMLWLSQRRPKSFLSSIDEFRREMDALARDPGDGDGRRRPRPAGRRPRSRPDPIMPAPGHGDVARTLRAAREHASDPIPEDWAAAEPPDGDAYR